MDKILIANAYRTLARRIERKSLLAIFAERIKKLEDKCLTFK